MSKPLRIPAGVTIGGKAMGGRFVTAAQVAQLARRARKSEQGSVERLARLAFAQLTKATAAHQRAAERHMERGTPKAKRARFDAKRTQDTWGTIAARTQRAVTRVIVGGSGPTTRTGHIRVPQFVDMPAELARDWCGRFGIECDDTDIHEDDDAPDDTVLAQLPRRGRWIATFAAPPAVLYITVSARKDDTEVEAVEWEVAVEYEAQASGGRGGRASPTNVDINIRFAREDGGKIRESEAMRVFQYMKDSGGEPPDGYVVAGVDWRNPRRSSEFRSHGDPHSNLESLWAPIYMASSFRLGAVEE